MNFLHTFESRKVAVKVELKYCERCGGLWLRRKGADIVLCDGCRAQMAALLHTGRKSGKVQRRPQGTVGIDCLLGVAEVEVRA